MSSKLHSRRTLALLFALTLIPYALLVFKFDFLTDEAFVDFRCAKNLVAGQGLLFNPGRSAWPNRPGLWACVMAAGEFARLGAPIWSKIVTASCAVALLWLILRTCARSFGASSAVSLAVGLFVVTLAPFAVYSTSGLPAMASALSLFLVYERLLGDSEHPQAWQAGIAAAIATELAGDGAWQAAGILAACALSAFFTQRRERIAPIARAALGIVLGFVVSLMFRPPHLVNTFSLAPEVLARETIERGFDYLCTVMLAFPGLIAMLFLAPLALGPTRIERGLPVLLILAALVSHCVLTGGDFLPMAHALLCTLPFFALAFALVASAIEEHKPRPILVGFLALLLIALSLPTAFDHPLAPRSLRERHDFRYGHSPYVTEVQAWENAKRETELGLVLGKALSQHTQREESLLRAARGAVGYNTELAVLPPAFKFHGNSYPILEGDPTYLDARIEALASESHVLFRVDPDRYGFGWMEWIERHVLDPREFTPALGFPKPSVLHVHRAVHPGAQFDRLIPWIDAARELDLSDAQAAQKLLAERVPMTGAAVDALHAWLMDQYAHPAQACEPGPDDPIRARSANPGFFIEVGLLEGPASEQRRPQGEIDLLIPLQGAPSLDGRTDGIMVLSPDTNSALRVTGGVMGIVTLRPGAGH